MVRETFDLSFIASILPKLFQALPVTLGITAASAAAGCLVGLLLTFGKLGAPKSVRAAVNGLTVLLRGIPTVVLLYLVYFGLPMLVQWLTGYDLSVWPKQIFVVIALSVELAVISSEMFRSAYNSLGRGQLEAAHALGMTARQRFLRIIVPQGLYVILPNLTSAVLALIQGTALAYTLGIMDIMGKARVLDTNAFNMKTLESYAAVALLYWGISILTGRSFGMLEKYLGRGQRTAGAMQN